MSERSYPSTISGGDEKRHYDVFARLRVITDWPGFAQQQRERRQWCRDWLDEHTGLSDAQAQSAMPVRWCDLPQPKHDSDNEKAQQEAAFIAEREVWWLLDDIGPTMQQFKSANRAWLEQRRKEIWNNAEGNGPGEPGWGIDGREQRYDDLAVATKHGSAWEDWKRTHDTTTGERKDDGDWRDRSARWHDDHLGITENPADSNRDDRDDGITASQTKCAGGGTWLVGQPWCGVWAFRGLLAADKVKADGSASWMASVASIEDYARQAKGPFRGWTSDGSKAKLGDLVILFGRGAHVGTVRDVDASYVYTWEGNTSSSSGGSQSNGGGSYKRSRSRNGETYGYALVK